MISTDISAQLVIHTVVGATTLEAVTEAMTRWYNDPRFDPDRPILWDAREAQIELAGTDLSEWADRNATMIEERRAGQKTAWVFNDAVLAEHAVDLLGARDWQNRVRIFNNDIEAATAWVKSPIR